MGYGLRKYVADGNKFNAHLLPGFSVRGIIPDSENNIYAVDYGYALVKINGQLMEKDPFKKFPQVALIDNFLISKSGRFWLKSETEDFKSYYDYNPVSGKLTRYPLVLNEASGDKQPLIEDSKGYIWFPVRGGKFRRIHEMSGSIDSFTININNTKPLNTNSVCTALYEDGQGVCWVGTQEGFAKLVFDSRYIAPDVKWFYNKAETRNSLSYNHVSCFMDDPAEPDKYLWICTKGGGLNRMNKVTGDFLHLTSKQGLPDDVVYGVLPDDAKNIWGSTNNGL
ncbi:MAG TPA: two-component regulator propeller domain-containing protein, partial [Agriterribacter sp.]|nr:two-component regulator propeller domain-containing protein [Agriterribacter sp.]